MKNATSLEYQHRFSISNQIVKEFLILDRILLYYFMENKNNESDEVYQFILNSITLLWVIYSLVMYSFKVLH